MCGCEGGVEIYIFFSEWSSESGGEWCVGVTRCKNIFQM